MEDYKITCIPVLYTLNVNNITAFWLPCLGPCLSEMSKITCIFQKCSDHKNTNDMDMVFLGGGAKEERF